MIDEGILQEAALQLLGSSTIRRYMREARRLAAASGVADAVHTDPRRRLEARDRALALLAELRGETQRTPGELELALLLCALARADAAGSADVLNRAVDSRCAWIRSLAGRLLALGPATPEDVAEVEQQLAPVLQGDVVVVASPPVSDRGDPTVFPRAA